MSLFTIKMLIYFQLSYELNFIRIVSSFSIKMWAHLLSSWVLFFIELCDDFYLKYVFILNRVYVFKRYHSDYGNYLLCGAKGSDFICLIHSVLLYVFVFSRTINAFHFIFISFLFHFSTNFCPSSRKNLKLNTVFSNTVFSIYRQDRIIRCAGQINSPEKDL